MQQNIDRSLIKDKWFINEFDFNNRAAYEYGKLRMSEAESPGTEYDQYKLTNLKDELLTYENAI